MKWRDLGLTVAVLLFLAPYLSAQTQPVGTQGSVSGGIGRFADGTAALPPIAFVNETNSGIYRNASQDVRVAIGGTDQFRFAPSEFQMASGTSLRWSSGSVGSSSDTLLSRAGAASISANNGTTPAAIQNSGTARVLAIPGGAYGFATASTTSMGNTGQGGRLVVVCGPTSGTASLLFYAGTTNVPVVLANAVGGGLIGC